MKKTQKDNSKEKRASDSKQDQKQFPASQFSKDQRKDVEKMGAKNDSSQ